jgi:hypothetical protein
LRRIPGPADLRYYEAYQLVAWQPRGILNDDMLDQIADWLLKIENVSRPFIRFVDFSRLTRVAVRTRHVFEFSERRLREYTGLTPIRTALFCNFWVGFGIALLYETLMKDTRIEARAFRDLTSAAAWLSVPVDILSLADKPAPHT